MLKRGYRWVLGDGQLIDICKDPWLKGKDGYHVEDKSYPADIAQGKVNDLFVQGTKTWDVAKVTRSFDRCDANAILTTRIPQISTIDRVGLGPFCRWSVHCENGV